MFRAVSALQYSLGLPYLIHTLMTKGTSLYLPIYLLILILTSIMPWISLSHHDIAQMGIKQQSINQWISLFSGEKNPHIDWDRQNIDLCLHLSKVIVMNFFVLRFKHMKNIIYSTDRHAIFLFIENSILHVCE